MDNLPPVDDPTESLSSGRPKRRAANVHPGRVLLEGQTKRRTSAQKQADDDSARETLAAKVAALQKGHQRVSDIEEQMKMDQGNDTFVIARPLKPRPRPRVRAANMAVTKENSNNTGNIGMWCLYARVH